MKALEIPVSRLKFGKNVRFERDTDMVSLANNIAECGVLQPLLVTPLKDGYYKVICGHRRFMAAKFNNLETVPCIVRPVMNEREEVTAQISENLARKNMSAMEYTEAFNKLKDICGGITNRELAKILNISEHFITNQYSAVHALNEMYGTTAEYERASKKTASVLLKERAAKNMEPECIASGNFIKVFHKKGTASLRVTVSKGGRFSCDDIYRQLRRVYKLKEEGK